MPIQSFHAAELNNKVVLLRTDYNVPMRGGKVTDKTRLLESLSTIRELQKAKAKIVIISHFGRPEGKITPELTLKPIAKALGSLLFQKINFCPETIGEKVENEIARLKPGKILMLENLRFHKQEEKMIQNFPRAWLAWGIYISMMPSASHIVPMLPHLE